MSRLFKAVVKENRQLTKNHYLITLHPSKKITKPKPGQFFMLAVDKSLDPLLKRPFSLYRKSGEKFQILYRVVGKATTILKDKKTGDIIEVLGPLGNGFPGLKPKIAPLFVAGGLGVVPLFSLAESFADKTPLFFLGAKNKKEILCVNELKKIGIKPIIATDNGSMGQKGFITDLLKYFLTHHASRLPTGQAGITHYCLYACGPKPMLKELSFLLKKFRINAYAAFEENMACGLGSCLSCVIKTKNGFKRVCKEGPVFPIEEIVW